MQNTEPVVYPGTFDPVTFGHLDIIERASKLFSRIIVAVSLNPGKHPLFSVEERMGLLREALNGKPGVEIECFDGLLLDFVTRRGAKIVLRGLRAVSDFEFEFQMALSNRKLNSDHETLFLMPSEEYSFVSSRIIKEIAVLGGAVEKFVPANVAERLKEKYNSR